MADTGIKIASISSSILLAALEVADSCATDAGRSKGGWIRLARVQGSAESPYVIAVRRVSTDRKVQFSCSCPDFLYRKQKIPGALFKHQQRFFNECATKPGQFWFYKAGHAFTLSVLSQIVASVSALPIAAHKPSEAA
jgi:hypothetical protein